MKKVLSLVLVLAMVLSSMSFAFASNLNDIVDNDYEDAINTLVGLGIVAGYEDGTFRPEKTITRAEMAKLMVITLGYGDLVAGSKSNFADTQGHWADAYIALAAGKGIVQGDGNGKFRPDAIVSYDEAITMLVRGLGYTDTCNELKNMTWPTNFKVKAAELKLTKDVTLSSTGADRGGVAQLINNALKTALVTVNTDGDVIKATTTATNSDDEVVTKYVLLLSRLATSKTIAKVTPDYLDEDSKLYAGNIVDLAPYMYQEIEVYENDDDEVVYVNDVESDVKVGEFRNATDDLNKVNVRIDGKNKLYTLKDSAETPVFYNGVEVIMSEKEMEIGREDGDASKTKEIVDLHKAAATFVLNDDDEIVGIVADKYTEARRVGNEYNGRTKFEGFALPLDDDDEVDYTKLTVTGEVDKLEDIQEDDVIVLFAGAGEVSTDADTEKLTIEVVRNTVEGKITRTNSDDEFYIDGTYYAASVYADYTFEVGEEGTYFLDQKGDLVDFEEDDADEPKDYAVITELLNGVISGTRTLADAEMSVVNAKGEEITYNFDEDAEITNSDDLIITEDADSIDINTDLKQYQVIKYTVNSKGDISKVTIVDDVDTTEDDKTDITGKSYVLASNAVIFNLDGDDVEVVSADKLGDEVVILSTEDNKNGEIELMFVKGLGSSATYAYIVDKGTMWNDDDDEVQSLIAYVDGVEVFYEADELNVIGSNLVDTATITELELDGDIVTGDVATHSAIVTDNITKVKGDRFEANSTWYTLADDVAVYILDDGEFDSVGDASSIYFDAEIAGFAFDEDNIEDNVIEVLFIFE
ncbi:hypothetical protein J2Z76_002226 [Sedimentibacter acidaminivorans]|jgi:S-layer family protein|uniref:SLH domain-containing protein n=1 Tax=Sedimentibacter acidaminivorans TaxID=913099 RepID=A0ABS4GF95_9FIRM|nr:S-layer homology domain-containing protein [Sedimentibacter acidaminivorans]MBP1926361.1 hypothetical protein [Sedimentibacter acidaminivorans]